MSSGVFCTGWREGLTGSVSALGGEYYFYSNGKWCGDVGVTGLDLHLVWCFGDADMATACGSTPRCGWVLFFFCYTVLVCVSIV